MRKGTIYVFFLLLGTGLVLNSCKKNNETSDIAEMQDNDTQSAQDNALAEETFNDVNNITNQAAENGNSLSTYRSVNDAANLLSNCATVTLFDTSGHGTIVVNFGSTACLCNDLKYRKGTVNIHYSGLYRDSATVLDVTFNDYFVGRDSTNMYKVLGTKTVTNMGHNAAGHSVFNVQVNGSILNASGQTMTWVSNRTREWVAGESTTGIWIDDEYMITGSLSGTGFNGTTFTLNITQALHISLICRWVKDGKLALTPASRPTRYVDYGYPSGACDGQVKITISSRDYYVTLP